MWATPEYTRPYARDLDDLRMELERMLGALDRPALTRDEVPSGDVSEVRPADI
jgi:hypothetical protein